MRPLRYISSNASETDGNADLVMDMPVSVFTATGDHAPGCACCVNPAKTNGLADKIVYEGPNDGGDTIGGTIGTAGTIAIGATINGVTDYSGDADYYAITVSAGQAIQFNMNGAAYNGAAAHTDTFLRLLNSSGQQLATNDDANGTFFSQLTYTFATAGTYYISAEGYNSVVTGGYSLTAIDVPPPPALPVYTIPEIADQLLNGYWESNGSSGRRWAVGNTDITFNVTGLSAERAAIARLAFATWADVTGLTFTETTGTAEITLDDNDSGAYSSSSTTGGTPRTIVSSSINVATSWYGGSSAVDSYTLQTFIHEIGHSLGLGHGGNYNGSATYGVDNHYQNDTWQYTIMSYMEQDNYGGATTRFVFTPQMADIYALQQYYGAGTARSTDTTYGFNVSGLSGLTAQLYTFSNFTTAPALTIYDSGGNDTLDVSGYSQNQLINLNGGTWSNIGGLVGNIGIYTTSVIENAVGGAGHDTIIGNAANNMLTGGAGNDTLDGGDGNDFLNGGEGNDSLSGGDSDDTLTGGAGTDILNGGAGNDRYNISDALDTIIDSGGIDTVYSTVNFTLAAGVGVEIIRANAGTTGLSLTGNEFANELWGNIGNDTLNGGDGDDFLHGNAGNDSLFGGLGNDTLTGGGGIDTMEGGTGNDVYSINHASDIVMELAGEGIDELIADVSYVLAAGQEIEIIRTNAGSTGLNVTGNEFSQTFWGGAGSDTLNGGGGNDTFFANSGNDLMISGDGNDALYGSKGNDTLISGAGDDTLSGGGGNGVDSMTGGTGNDIYYAYHAADVVIEGVGEGIDQLYAAISYTLAAGQEIEVLRANAGGIGLALTGNEFTHAIWGNIGADSLTGGNGDDALYGNAGSDTLIGGAGNDTLVGSGGAGIDRLIGGTGNDIYAVSHTADVIVELAGQGTDELIANVNYTLAAGVEIETIRANAGATGLALTGNEFNQTFWGGIGSDTLNGGGGNDTFFANAGNDLLLGGDGNDSLYGSSGNDSLTGGAGNDLLNGGAGNDTFIFNTADFVAGNVDTISGFGITAGSDDDVLRLQGTAGNYAFANISGGVQVTNIATGSTINVMNAGLTAAALGAETVYF